MIRRTFLSVLAAGVATVALGFGLGASPAAAASAEKPKVAVVLKTLSSQYWRIVAAGAKAAAEKNGVELILLGPPTEDAIEQQINMVQDALAQKVDALVFSPSQPGTAVNILTKVRAAGVPVILVDTGMPESFTDYTTFIGTDNIAAGKAGGAALAKLLKAGDKVVLIDGAPGTPSTTDRINGAEDVLKEANIIIAARQPAYSDREKGYTVMQNILQSTPDVAGVFAANDEMALGALRALKQAGKSVPVIGVDANNDNLKAIMKGDIYGSIAQGNYQMGELGVQKALDAIAGKPVDKRIDSGAELITKANAKELQDFRASIN